MGGFVFAFNITATIILVCIIVAVLLPRIGLMQKVVSVIAKAMNWVMRVSGAEALSNVASAFVGQVEAQVMIRPYLAGMTRSELLASMTGSLACIAGSILVVYVAMGAQPAWTWRTETDRGQPHGSTGRAGDQQDRVARDRGKSNHGQCEARGEKPVHQPGGRH
jgi:hypothetical protein